jgi:putative Mg2+ transporter-C (MgtC) family protein
VISYFDAPVRLVAALLCGVVLGLNRQLHGKLAGVRTQGVVALGAALATIAGALADDSGAGVTRVMQGIVAGIGFLGAGVIVKSARSEAVHGLTTAAITWLSGALGIACGAGLYLPALSTLVLTLGLLWFGPRVEGWMHRRWPVSEGKPPEGTPQ